METHDRKIYRLRAFENNFADFIFGFMVSFGLIDYTVGVSAKAN